MREDPQKPVLLETTPGPEDQCLGSPFGTHPAPPGRVDANACLSFGGGVDRLEVISEISRVDLRRRKKQAQPHNTAQHNKYHGRHRRARPHGVQRRRACEAAVIARGAVAAALVEARVCFKLLPLNEAGPVRRDAERGGERVVHRSGAQTAAAAAAQGAGALPWSSVFR